MDQRDLIIAGIGSSMGGLYALNDFFTNLSSAEHIAFIVLTHLGRAKSHLDRILKKYTNLNVQRIQGGELVTGNTIYVLPEASTLHIRKGRLILEPRMETSVINKVIDEFFVSLAHDQKHNAIGIIFSGAGSDGANGSKTIHETGGKILVQDPKSAEFPSMPLATIHLKIADIVLTPSELAKNFQEILSKCHNIHKR